MVVLVLLVLPMMDTSYSTSRVYDYLVLVVLVMVIVTHDGHVVLYLQDVVIVILCTGITSYGSYCDSYPGWTRGTLSAGCSTSSTSYSYSELPKTYTLYSLSRV